MKALSVRQPWASLIASGRKTVELRTWRTHYRGPLLIVSGARPWKGDHGFELGPLGVTVCTVELVDVVPFSERHRKASCVPVSFDFDPTKKWFSWLFRNVNPVQSVPTSGRLGLYEPRNDLVRAVGLK